MARSTYIYALWHDERFNPLALFTVKHEAEAFALQHHHKEPHRVCLTRHRDGSPFGDSYDLVTISWAVPGKPRS